MNLNVNLSYSPNDHEWNFLKFLTADLIKKAHKVNQNSNV